MSKRSIFAPIFIDRMWLTDIGFNLGMEPADSMTVKVDISYEASELSKGEDGVCRESLDFTVRAFLINEEDSDDVRLSAMARIQTFVGADLPGISDDEAGRYLTRNALSMSYAHARSCIMSVTALSPMRGFILPPVIPDEIIDGDSQENAK